MRVTHFADEDQDPQEGDHPDRQVDVKNPPPAVVFGQPAAEHRAEDRAEHDADPPHGDRLSVALGRVDLHQDRLRQWHQARTADALQQPEEDQLAQAGGAAAQGGGEGEASDRNQKHVFDAETAGEPAGQRHRDRGGDNVRGQNPGDLVLRRRQAPLDMREGDIGDRVVDALHDRRQHDRHGDRRAVAERAAPLAPHRDAPGRGRRRLGDLNERAARDGTVNAAFSPKRFGTFRPCRRIVTQPYAKLIKAQSADIARARAAASRKFDGSNAEACRSHSGVSKSNRPAWPRAPREFVGERHRRKGSHCPSSF